MGRMRMFLCVIIVCGVLFCELSAVNIPSAEENRAGKTPEISQGKQGIDPAAKQDEFNATLNRLSASNQESYLEELKDMDKQLREKYAALSSNYGAYRAGYMRVQSDIKQGRQTPGFVMKNLQDLEAGREKLETGIRELEEKKKGLHAKALASFGGVMPAELAREWETEEESYRNDISLIYRKIGWWMGLEYSPLWRNDEKLFWEAIQNYYRLNKAKQEKLKEP